VDYTIQVGTPQPSTATAQVAVVVFAYSDRGLALRLKAFDEYKSVLPTRASAGWVNLRLPQLAPGAKWKPAVLVSSGVFTKEAGSTEQFSAGKSAVETAIALAALYSAHR